MLLLTVLVCCLAACNAGIPVRRPLPILPIPKPSAGRIVGGQTTTIDNVPYQVALLYGRSLMCGGSIARADVVISAGHCVVSFNTNSYSIRAGSSYHASGGEVVSVSKVLRHNNYDSFDIDYDISLFFLTSSISFGTNAQPIALPTINKSVPAGSPATTSGWGTTSEGGSVASSLRKVDIPIVDQGDCSSAYSKMGWFVTDRMICAGLIETGGKDACQGDSGGPLVVDNELVGVTSWGYGCARAGYPGVWARVPALVDWINSNIN